jgi:hypothetical protein
MKEQRLSLDVVFDRDGHLEEVALVALADGQDVLPGEAALHLETCDVCCGRLADAALVSVQVSELLRAATPSRERSPALVVAAPADPLPWGAVCLVLALALVGLAPSIARGPQLFSQAAAGIAHLGPVLAHGLSATLGAHSRAGALAREGALASSVLLIVFGLTIARWFRHEGAAS